MTDLDKARYERAKKRAEEVKGFYIHLGIYLIVNAALFLINILTSDTLWFYWPLIGWGIGVAIHAFSLLVEDRVLGPGWEERKIRSYMDEEEQRTRRSA